MTVSIRPLKIEDAYTSVKWRNDSEVFRYTGNTYDHSITIESELAWIKRVINKEDDYRCAIEVDGIYVGNIYLTDIHDGEAEYHIFLGNKEYWGKGIAKEASLLIFKRARDIFNLNKILLAVNEKNISAIKLYESLGFVEEYLQNSVMHMCLDMKRNNEILVAIHCLVYNHEPYLRDCFEGFVMQKTNFRFVAIVHEDCSTDHSADIIREYEAKYPDIFRPIYETENQYSKPDGSLGRIMNEAIDSTGAKYIAMCEGDDYWIDPYKLQKQVDYMESHPDCACCAHNTLLLNNKTGQIALFNKKLFSTENYTLDTFLTQGWFTATQTLLYRRSTYHTYENMPNFVHGDYFLQLNLLSDEGSYLHYEDEIMSVYRDGGWASTYFHDKQVELCDDFIALLNFFKEHTNHRSDSVFDDKINEQIQRKEQLIKDKNAKPKSRSFIERVWGKIGKLLCSKS